VSSDSLALEFLPSTNALTVLCTANLSLLVICHTLCPLLFFLSPTFVHEQALPVNSNESVLPSTAAMRAQPSRLANRLAYASACVHACRASALLLNAHATVVQANAWSLALPALPAALSCALDALVTVQSQNAEIVCAVSTACAAANETLGLLAANVVM
jgi:hypothetical protein